MPRYHRGFLGRQIDALVKQAARDMLIIELELIIQTVHAKGNGIDIFDRHQKQEGCAL